MSEPRSLRDRLLEDLRRELRQLGRRARRRALDEARDHLLSAIEDEIAEGASPVQAEQRAVARFGQPAEIAARLCAARPDRRRRVLPALAGAAAITGVLALAAGPIADDIAPHRASAAAVVGPSEQGCASAFDGAANNDVRDLVPRSNVLRVQIFATPVPSCVIKFQLPDERVMTVQAPWLRNSAAGFRASIVRPGLVAGPNATWRNGYLTATGLLANHPLVLGPPPTVASCLDAWNASPPGLHVTGRPSAPAVVQALSGGVSVVSSGSVTQPEIAGYACIIWAATPSGHATYVVGAWTSPGTAEWRKPIVATGMISGALPNADLGADGRLTLRKAVATTPAAPGRPSAAHVTHRISASGWAGGFPLHGTLSQAIRRFGTPTDRVPSGFGCEITWPALHLSGSFMFGFVRHGKRAQQPTPCGGTGRAMSLTATSTWSTNHGLRVGDPESEIARRYPGATSVTSAATGTTTWYLVPRHGGPSAEGLTAETVLGTVTALTAAAGGTTFGMTIVPARTPLSPSSPARSRASTSA